MTARYDMYAEFFRKFTDMNYEPQVIGTRASGTRGEFNFWLRSPNFRSLNVQSKLPIAAPSAPYRCSIRPIAV